MRKNLLVLMACGLTLWSFQSANAAPCGQPVLLGHSQGSYFVCADSGGKVAAYAYQLSLPTTVSTGAQNIVCLAFDGSSCFGSAGTVGDSQVTIESDWSNPAIAGCPVDASGGHRIVLVTQCADGKGVIVSLSGADSSLAYTVEAAHPYNSTAGTFQPLTAGVTNGRPQLVGNATVSGGSATMLLRFAKPIIYTDCDAGSLGVSLGSTCVDGVFPTGRDPNVADSAVTMGHVYTSSQPCGVFPDAQLSKWTDTGVVIPPQGGDVPVTAAVPTQPASCASSVPPANRTGCLCLYVGGTITVANSGTTSPGVSGFVQVGGPEAASPVALGVRAAQAAGKVRVTWHTDSELALAGFNILGDSKKVGALKVNDALIPATGNGGGASYDIYVPRAKFKTGRTVIVESVLTDGTTIRSTPAKF